MLAWSCIQLMTRNILMCHTFTPMPKKLFVSCLHFHRLISLCDMVWIRKSLLQHWNVIRFRTEHKQHQHSGSIPTFSLLAPDRFRGTD
jgi:hypothetical protein